MNVQIEIFYGVTPESATEFAHRRMERLQAGNPKTFHLDQHLGLLDWWWAHLVNDYIHLIADKTHEEADLYIDSADLIWVQHGAKYPQRLSKSAQKEVEALTGFDWWVLDVRNMRARTVRDHVSADYHIVTDDDVPRPNE